MPSRPSLDFLLLVSFSAIIFPYIWITVRYERDAWNPHLDRLNFLTQFSQLSGRFSEPQPTKQAEVVGSNELQKRLRGREAVDQWLLEQAKKRSKHHLFPTLPQNPTPTRELSSNSVLPSSSFPVAPLLLAEPVSPIHKASDNSVVQQSVDTLPHTLHELQAHSPLDISYPINSKSFSTRSPHLRPTSISAPPLQATLAGKKSVVGSGMDTNVLPSGGRALIFTMDSIDAYVADSKKGGASGEIIIRKSLVAGLKRIFGMDCDVATSDAHFTKLARKIDAYKLIILDAWTWADKGWVPKPPLRNREGKIFLLDFFGARGPTRNGIKVPPSRILTAFPTSPWNTFLGYAVDPLRLSAPQQIKKKKQGVLWGKTAKHFAGSEGMVAAVADQCDCTLHSTLSKAPHPLMRHRNIVYHGHLNPEQWHHLLESSMFMIGLGNPLLGPSAVDAVVAGCVYINPVYDKPVKEVYLSQHPYLKDAVGGNHVCSVRLKDQEAVLACVERALSEEVSPIIPKELTIEEYSHRIVTIFGPSLSSYYS